MTQSVISSERIHQIPYPIFSKPEQYLRFRNGGIIFGFIKRFVEYRAIDRCLSSLHDVKTICDCPCGPGRLFPYWKKRNYHIIGAELSEPMVNAARQRYDEFGLRGSVSRADAFNLDQEISGELPDLVASIRFCYYFNKDARIELIQKLANTSRRYLLLQYKTKETFKGMRNTSPSKLRRRTHPCSKHYLTNQEIAEEIQIAGLKCLRIENISQASDFTFVLAEK